MPIAKNFYPSAYYYIFNRGAAGQNIFQDKADYIFYLRRLRSAKEKCGISIICYCLMPDSLHLLVRQNAKVSVSRFIQSLHTGYSMYFNKRHRRFGHLFQGSFRQKKIAGNNLTKISSKIHLIGGREDYQWSSYPDYLGKRQGTLCEKEVVLKGINF